MYAEMTKAVKLSSDYFLKWLEVTAFYLHTAAVLVALLQSGIVCQCKMK